METVDRYYDGKEALARVSLYDKKTGITYTSYAKAHPEDMEYKSQQIGFDVAELKCLLKKAIKDYKAEKKAYAACQNFMTCLEKRKLFEVDSSTAKACYAELSRRQKDLDNSLFDIKVLKWILNQIYETGAKAEDVLTKLTYAIENNEI